jgi:hypothetical protein
VSFLRKPARRGLRPGEELLLEVEVAVLDSSGTNLPGPGTAIVVGVSDERILVWSIPKPPMQTNRLLGAVNRSRLVSATAERRDDRIAVVLKFEEQAQLVADAPGDRHPEQLVWLLTADLPQNER